MTLEGLRKAINELRAETRRGGRCLRVNLDSGDPETLLFSMTRFFKFLHGEQRQAFLGGLSDKAS